MAVRNFKTSSIKTGVQRTTIWDQTASPTPYEAGVKPVAWYVADDLTSAANGTVWTNRASNYSSTYVTANMTSRRDGTLISNWRNGHKALSNFQFKADGFSDSATLDQRGNLTLLVVSFTDNSGFGPYFGVGEMWGNYSSAYGGYYYHGLYSSGWGYFTATPAVMGLTHVLNEGYLTTISNNNRGGDSFGLGSGGANEINVNSDTSADGIAEVLVYNTVLTSTQLSTVISALRAKYAF